jgi:SAM-dependent methyltransferase
MDLEAKGKIFDGIFGDVDGHKISHEGRRAMGKKESAHLIYGEIPFHEFIPAIRDGGVGDAIGRAKVFCDMGSGTGKILVGVALTCPQFEKIVGIELVEPLVEASKQAKVRLTTFDPTAAEKIQIINKSFFDVDLSPTGLAVDVVFMHYPIHGAEELYLALEEKFRNELKPGTIIISGIRRLVDGVAFPSVAPSKTTTAKYGNCTMYYHRRS